MGVKHFCLGWDVSILARFWATAGAEMRGVKAAALPPPPNTGYR
jgi:hypothetical protein